MNWIFTVALIAGFTEARLPPNHPVSLNDFGGHFRCPYSSEWLRKGPELAARELGLIDENQHFSDGRVLQPGGSWPNPPNEGPVNCQIAPGPIGAGHQAGFSSGYSNACPGTPAEGSPYMWPLAWSAGVEAKSMAFGSDDIVYHSIGQVYYRLDKNWKRQDWFYQRGVQRAVGQGPCDPENVVSDPDEPVIACRRDSDNRTTMIHRGSQMFFISWKNATAGDSVENIRDCRWLDLQVVGNIRPDWYMDARGDSTDVQYLGDQHVFYENEPRLVKQWRKKDFASQYFVMSVLANPKEDEMHWPMILNVPGEGFGDDFLQVYTNHSKLTGEDDGLFLLDKALDSAGGECPKMESYGTDGPPTGDVEPIPSNLEVDPNSWRSIVYTYSPVWEPPVPEDDTVDPADEVETAGTAITEAGSAIVATCYDSSADAVELTVSFDYDMAGEEIPWVALGYRETEECLMTPRGGGSSDIILIESSRNVGGDFESTASFGLLSPSVKRFNSDAVSSIYENLVPLGDAEGFSDVQVSILSADDPTAIDTKSNVNGGSIIQLSFKQNQTPGAAPGSPMNLMYAIGKGQQLGYHSSRLCFQVSEFPPCPMSDAGDQTEVLLENEGEASAAPYVSSIFSWVLTLGLVAAFCL